MWPRSRAKSKPVLPCITITITIVTAYNTTICTSIKNSCIVVTLSALMWTLAPARTSSWTISENPFPAALCKGVHLVVNRNDLNRVLQLLSNVGEMMLPPSIPAIWLGSSPQQSTRKRQKTSSEKYSKSMKNFIKVAQGVCWAFNRDQPVNSVGVPMERGKVESWYFIFAWEGRWELVLYLCWLYCKILGKINKMTNWTRTLVSPPCWLTSTPWAINCSTSWWRKKFWWIRLQKV